MKYLILNLFILFSIQINAQIGINGPISDFDKVMQSYNDAYTATDDPTEQEKVNEKFEKLISKAEQELEAAIEKQFQEELTALQKEQKEAAQVEEDIEEVEEVEKNIEEPADTVAPLEGLAAIAKKEIDGKSYDKSITALKKRFKRSELHDIATQLGYKIKSGNKTVLSDFIVREISFQ